MMIKQKLTVAAVAIFGVVPCSAEPYTPGVPVLGNYKNYAAVFLDHHCIDCHDDATQKGDLMLHNLGPVDETNAIIWKSVWAQVTLEQIPPKKEDQPELIERLKFSDWIVAELQRVMKDKGGSHAHLDPKKGNFLNHDLLFGNLPDGIKLVPTSSPTRIWRVTPQEHITRLNELINTEPQYNPAKSGLRSHGAEPTQILGKAENILRYMAYGPLSIAKPEQITDDPNTYKMEGEIRGLPTALVYNTKVARPLTPFMS